MDFENQFVIDVQLEKDGQLFIQSTENSKDINTCYLIVVEFEYEMDQVKYLNEVQV